MTSILLVGGRIVGGDGSPADVLVRDGVIASIGRGLPPGDAERVDLDGRFVAPGLWDHHVHFSQWSLKRQRADVSRTGSAAEAARVVGEWIRERSPASDDIVVGYGFRDALWPDAPSRALLDAVSPDRPVVLVSGDIHCVWLNAAAQRRLGAPDDATGMLREQPAFEVNTAVSAVDDATLDGWARDAAQAAAERGVVGVVELEMAPNLDVWARRVASGAHHLRVRCGVYLDHLDDAVARGMRTGDVLPDTRGLVSLGPFKIITDGSLNTRTAHCHDPYPPEGSAAAGFGAPTYEFEELVEHLRHASSHGLVPAVHAIGDRANALALDAFEAVGCGGGIEHAQLVGRADFARFARLGVVASVQPEHAMDDRDVADRLWAGRTDRAFAFESLLAAGASLRLGSDAPVSPLDPWVSMAAAVSRRRDGREPWHPEQRIARAAAFAASVRDPQLRVGADADLVVTDVDPLTATDDELRSMPVAATMLAGGWTHSAL